MNELSEAEYAYIRRKKALEYEYAAPYLPVGAVERMDEGDLRDEVRTIIMEYLPPAERQQLAAELTRERRRLFGDDHDLAPSSASS